VNPYYFEWIIYAVPLLAIWALYVRKRHAAHVQSSDTLQENREAGLDIPASLHPIINTSKCIGCESCIAACPEMPAHQVLGMVRRKATLVSPAECIGHGACRTACPVDAISLVFGTTERGVDIPHVKPNFESNIPGIYIAGELGGMGLIRNAIEQGRQALESIAGSGPRSKQTQYDVVIVGAGPSGFAAALSAHERNLSYVVIEQESLGGAVAHFPRRKLVMTAPAQLPIVGKMKFGETTKEELLQFWTNVEQRVGLRINYRERVESVEPVSGGFKIVTTKGAYDTKALLLAMGRRGTPRKLGVPGEDLDKVMYRLVDAQQFKNQRVLIVGGGDSAVESALAIAEQPGTEVHLSYRSSGFTRVKRRNREKLEAARIERRVNVVFESVVTEITPDYVVLEQNGKKHKLVNDAVIINAGGVLPTPFLKEIGIDVETKFGTV